MFAYYFVDIEPGPFPEVQSALLAILDGLSEEAAVAYREGEELRSRLTLDGSPVAKTVHLRVGSPLLDESQLLIPLRWEATGVPGLFPRMEAELVASPLGPDLTHISFRGWYRPPLGSVGRALDRAVLHRVAERCVATFVDRLAASVAERLAEPRVSRESARS